MEQCKKQGRCNKFPFCEENPKNCNKFEKRNYEMKQVKEDGISFTFERIG
jgi:hypothetical protein